MLDAALAGVPVKGRTADEIGPPHANWPRGCRHRVSETVLEVTAEGRRSLRFICRRQQAEDPFALNLNLPSLAAKHITRLHSIVEDLNVGDTDRSHLRHGAPPSRER